MNSVFSKDSLISLKEAGELLKVNPRTIRRMSHRGELPKLVKVGKLSRLLYSDVLNYIQSLKQQRA